MARHSRSERGEEVDSNRPRKEFVLSVAKADNNKIELIYSRMAV
jgi:hypothetical protein